MSFLQERVAPHHRQPRDADAPGALQRLDNPDVISATIPIAIAFTSMGLYGVSLSGTPLPLTTIVLALAVIGAMFLRPTRGLHRPSLIMLLLPLLLAWLAWSTYLNQLTAIKRGGSLMIWLAIILAISSGRLCRASIGRGLGIGLTLAVGWAIFDLPASDYQGRLTGTLGDPNSAGMVLCVAGFAAISSLSHRSARLTFLAVITLGVSLTLSRTSFLALTVILLWVVLTRWIPPRALLPLTVGSLIWLSTLPEKTFASQQFAERAGSDALRGRIAAAEHTAVARHPLYGNGAGTAQVNVQSDTFFYHNSYLGLRAEGGYIALFIMLFLGIGLMWAMVSLPRQQRNLWLEASVLGVGVCALNLGSVLLATPAAISVGMALRHIALERRRLADDAGVTPIRATLDPVSFSGPR